MRTFFAQQRGDSLEAQYCAIWNQIFLLKEYCKFSLFELKMMTAEERVWYIDRYNIEQEKKQKEEQKASKRSSPNVRRR
mgnify:FL=1